MKICLNMIVKNEEAVILRCLNNIYRFIDCYQIVDTGSNDNTKKLIIDFFQEKNIPGQVHEMEWENFEVCRNAALNKVREYANALEEAEQVLAFIADADDFWQFSESYTKEYLKTCLHNYDSGLITCIQGGTEWSSLRFVDVKKSFKWICPVHEVLTCEEGYNPINLSRELIHNVILTDGNSWTSQDSKQKYLNYAKILTDWIEKNGNEPRAVFYAAQCFKDAEEYQKALEWYEKRVLIYAGFYEERYYSQLMIAQMKWHLQKPVSEVADEFMKCCEIDNERAEHLYNLKLMYERNNRPISANKISELLKQYKGKYPNRLLFISKEIYN